MTILSILQVNNTDPEGLNIYKVQILLCIYTEKNRYACLSAKENKRSVKTNHIEELLNQGSGVPLDWLNLPNGSKD